MYFTMFNLNEPTETSRNKRTAKGLSLKGAQGKRARRDARGRTTAGKNLDQYRFKVSPSAPKPTLDRKQAINEQLDQGQSPAKGSRRRQRQFLSSNVARKDVLYTTESNRFRAVERAVARLEPRKIAIPVFDKNGIPIVIINTDDAWRLCRGPRPVRR